jgi:hypothetical protein
LGAKDALLYQHAAMIHTAAGRSAEGTQYLQ